MLPFKTEEEHIVKGQLLKDEPYTHLYTKYFNINKLVQDQENSSYAYLYLFQLNVR